MDDSFTVLTFDLELHMFTHQDVSLPTIDGAGVKASVYVCGVSQGQTEVSSFQCVPLHLCSSSVHLMLLFRLVIWIHVDLQVVPVCPLGGEVLRQVNYGFAGQLDRLHPRIHLHLVD